MSRERSCDRGVREIPAACDDQARGSATWNLRACSDMAAAAARTRVSALPPGDQATLTRGGGRSATRTGRGPPPPGRTCRRARSPASRGVPPPPAAFGARTDGVQGGHGQSGQRRDRGHARFRPASCVRKPGGVRGNGRTVQARLRQGFPEGADGGRGRRRIPPSALRVARTLPEDERSVPDLAHVRGGDGPAVQDHGHDARLSEKKSRGVEALAHAVVHVLPVRDEGRGVGDAGNLHARGEMREPVEQRFPLGGRPRSGHIARMEDAATPRSLARRAMNIATPSSPRRSLHAGPSAARRLASIWPASALAEPASMFWTCDRTLSACSRPRSSRSTQAGQFRHTDTRPASGRPPSTA